MDPITPGELFVLDPTQEGQRDAIINVVNAALADQATPGQELFSARVTNANPGIGDPLVRDAVRQAFVDANTPGPGGKWAKVGWAQEGSSTHWSLVLVR